MPRSSASRRWSAACACATNAPTSASFARDLPLARLELAREVLLQPLAPQLRVRLQHGRAALQLGLELVELAGAAVERLGHGGRPSLAGRQMLAQRGEMLLDPLRRGLALGERALAGGDVGEARLDLPSPRAVDVADRRLAALTSASRSACSRSRSTSSDAARSSAARSSRSRARSSTASCSTRARSPCARSCSAIAWRRASRSASRSASSSRLSSREPLLQRRDGGLAPTQRRVRRRRRCPAVPAARLRPRAGEPAPRPRPGPPARRPHAAARPARARARRRCSRAPSAPARGRRARRRRARRPPDLPQAGALVACLLLDSTPLGEHALPLGDRVLACALGLGQHALALRQQLRRAAGRRRLELTLAVESRCSSAAAAASRSRTAASATAA